MSLQLVSNTAAVKEVLSINLKLELLLLLHRKISFSLYLFIHTSIDIFFCFWHLLLLNAAKVNSILSVFFFFFKGIKNVFKKKMN